MMCAIPSKHELHIAHLTMERYPKFKDMLRPAFGWFDQGNYVFRTDSCMKEDEWLNAVGIWLSEHGFTWTMHGERENTTGVFISIEECKCK